MSTAVTEMNCQPSPMPGEAFGQAEALPQQVYPLSIAPMMDRTDRHYRYFMRQITQHTLLYTEMVTSQAILHGDRPHLLGFSPAEKPLVLQLGGDNPRDLAICAQIAEEFGYDQVNLNVGCPSDRVTEGNFGACLMLQPARVAECVAAMKAATSLPVTIKHRIGVDERDRYEDMVQFVETVAQAGCRQFSVHARKAWLQGLSPKENRDIPPLRYADVYRLKQDFPHLIIEINGGLTTLEQMQTQLQHVDAVMIGRAAYDNPYLFATVDQQFFGDRTPVSTRHQVVTAMLPYIEQWCDFHQGVNERQNQKQNQGSDRSRNPVFKLNKITRHMLQLFAGQPGSRRWKQILTEGSCLPGAGVALVKQALAEIPQAEIQPLEM